MNIYVSVFSLAVVLTLVGTFWLAIVGFKRSVPWGVLILLFSPITAIIYAVTNWFDARKAFVMYMVSFVLMCGAAILIYSEVGMGNMHQIAERMHSGKLGPFKAYALIAKALSQTGPIDLFAEEEKTVTADAGAAKPGDVTPLALPVPATEKDIAEAEAEAKAEKDAGKPAVAPKSDAKNEAATSPTAKPDAGSAEVNPPTVKSEKPKYSTPDQAQPDPLAQKKKKEEPNTVVVSMNKIANYKGHYFIITLKTGNQQRGLLRKVDDTKLYLDRKLYGGKFEYKIRKDQVKLIEMLKHVPEER